MGAQVASGRATVAADGRAVVTLGPGRAHERWSVTGYSVQLSTGDGELRLYQGSESADNFVEGTYDASQNSSDRAQPLVMTSAEALRFVFSDATNGATATARVRYDVL